MTIPPLVNEVLPPGTHPATLDETAAAFVQPGPRTRPALDVALRHAIALIWSKDPSAVILVNGGYVTSKADPVDVDIAVRSDVWDDTSFAVALAAAYPDDVALVDAFFNATHSPQHMEDLFREVPGSQSRKGIIRLIR